MWSVDARGDSSHNLRATSDILTCIISRVGGRTASAPDMAPASIEGPSKEGDQQASSTVNMAALELDTHCPYSILPSILFQMNSVSRLSMATPTRCGRLRTWGAITAGACGGLYLIAKRKLEAPGLEELPGRGQLACVSGTRPGFLAEACATARLPL